MEEENCHLVSTIADLQHAVHIVQTDLNLKKKDLTREKKITDINSARIEELQGIISHKTFEINKWNGAYNEAKRQLDISMIQVKNQEQAIIELHERLAQTEIQNAASDQQSHMCQQEISACLLNLQSLKEKMEAESELLRAKTEEFNKLQADYKQQCHNYEDLKRSYDEAQTCHKEEVISYKCTVSSFLFFACFCWKRRYLT